MSKKSENVIIQGETPLYDGFLKMKAIRLQHRRFSGEMSGVMTRELVQRVPAVGVLLYAPRQDRVVLIEQFRIGCLAEEHPWCLEVCAGLIDAGETPEEAARREALEETGCAIVELLPIARFYPSPGACDELLYLYCGLIDKAPSESALHGMAGEHEDIRTLPMSADEAEALLLDGRINNATALIALQWLWRYRREAEGSRLKVRG